MPRPQPDDGALHGHEHARRVDRREARGAGKPLLRQRRLRRLLRQRLLRLLLVLLLVLLPVAALRISGRRPRVPGLLGERCALPLLLHL